MLRGNTRGSQLLSDFDGAIADFDDVIEEEPEFVDAVEAPAEGAGEPEPAEDLREEAAAMTVAQLKHKLQTMGLAHLYAGKRGVKKADLVNMYVDGEEGGN